MSPKESARKTSFNTFVVAHGVAMSIVYIIVKGFLSYTTILDALAFYGVYHRDPMNQLIHFFGVPCIIWSMLIFLAHLNLNINLMGMDNEMDMDVDMGIDIPFAKKHRFNYSSVVILVYVTFYLYLDLLGGLLFAPFAYFMYVTANNVTITDRETYLREEEQELASKSKKDDDDGGIHINGDGKSNGDGNGNGKVPVVDKYSWTGTGRVLKMAGILHFLGWYVQIHPGHAIYEGATPAVTKSVGGALTSAPLFAYYEGLWFLGVNKQLQDATKVLVDQYSIELCKGGADMRACGDYDLN